MHMPEQALGWLPPELGLVVEDEFSCQVGYCVGEGEGGEERSFVFIAARYLLSLARKACS